MTAMLILGKTMSVNFHFTNKNIKKEKKLLPLLNYFQERGGQIYGHLQHLMKAKHN